MIGELTGVQTVRVPNLMVQEEEEILVDKEFPLIARGRVDEVIGINPGSVYGTAKRWMPERFAEVADQILEQRQQSLSQNKVVQCAIVGGPGEEGLGLAVAQSMKHQPLVLSGKTTIRQLLAIVKRCAVFLTNDTGPMHIADAFNVPVCGDLWIHRSEAYSPLPHPIAILFEFPSDAPRGLLRSCPIDHRCMTGVTVGDVYKASLESLSSKI